MDGIKINDASLEISPSGLKSLLGNQGADLTITKLDLTVSPEALNTLLTSLAPEGQCTPKAELYDGRMHVAANCSGKAVNLDLKVGGFRLEITANGLRLVSEGGG